MGSAANPDRLGQPGVPVKAWQKGYDLAALQAVAAVYAAHDAGLTFGAFSRMSEAAVAEGLASGRLRLAWDEGRPVAAAFVRTTRSRTVVNDYAGPFARVPVGTVMVRRPACLPGYERALYELVGGAASEGDAPLVVLECFVESEIDQGLVLHMGLAHLTTKVPASAELIGVFTNDAEVEGRPWPEPAGLAALDLPVFDVEAAAKEVDAAGLSWGDHYSTYNKRHSWSAVALRGFGGHPGFIIKPAEMSKKWQHENRKTLGWACEDTPLRAALPACEEIVAALPGAKQRIRLMRLTPGGGELTRHADITDPEAGCADGKVMRIHIPLVTNEAVRFWSWLPDGEAIERHMAEGAAWYLDTRKPHRALNGGTTDRVHLVVDCFAGPELRALVGAER